MNATARYVARYAVSNHPAYLPLARRRYRDRFPVLDKRTEMVIEGFGRSGNTFALTAFQLANPGVRVAHHSHAAATVKTAVRKGLPTLVVVRAPEDAVISRLALLGPPIAPSAVLWAWTRYHRAIADDCDGFVVLPTEELSDRLSSAIELVNRRFNRRFHAYDGRLEAVFDIIVDQNRRGDGMGTSNAAVPTQERRVRKAAVADRLREVPDGRWRRAEELHARLLREVQSLDA